MILIELKKSRELELKEAEERKLKEKNKKKGINTTAKPLTTI